MFKANDITDQFNALMKLDAMEKAPEETIDLSKLYDGKDFIDDISGAPLDRAQVVAARRVEMDFSRRKGVYTKVTAEPWMRVITTKWIDQNKGDHENPNYRARLVGREIATEKRDDLFAATPPLESMRMIISICASRQRASDRSKRFVIMTNDVKRAYFEAPASRPIYIRIPDEDWEEGDEGRVAKLNLSLYGTRDAALNWTNAYTTFLQKIGSTKGLASPCNFHHAGREISLTVHGDDFTSTGTAKDLNWLDGQLRSRFDMKTE